MGVCVYVFLFLLAHNNKGALKICKFEEWRIFNSVTTQIMFCLSLVSGILFSLIADTKVHHSFVCFEKKKKHREAWSYMSVSTLTHCWITLCIRICSRALDQAWPMTSYLCRGLVWKYGQTARLGVAFCIPVTNSAMNTECVLQM